MLRRAAILFTVSLATLFVHLLLFDELTTCTYNYNSRSRVRSSLWLSTYYVTQTLFGLGVLRKRSCYSFVVYLHCSESCKRYRNNISSGNAA